MNAMKERNNIGYITLLAFLTLVFACQNKKNLSPIAYIQWVESNENTLVAHKEVNGLIYELQYLPSEFLVLKDNPIINAKDFAKKVKENEGVEFFKLNISMVEENKGNILSFYSGNRAMGENERLDYFTNVVNKDLYCVFDKDTIPCSLHLPEFVRGITKTINIIVAFEEPIHFKNGKRVFIFNDMAFGNGTLKMEIDNNKMNHIPEVKI